MRVLAHANPQLRILEVGSGTGSATSKVLPFLVDTEGNQGDRLVRYVHVHLTWQYRSILEIAALPVIHK